MLMLTFYSFIYIVASVRYNTQILNQYIMFNIFFEEVLYNQHFKKNLKKITWMNLEKKLYISIYKHIKH